MAEATDLTGLLQQWSRGDATALDRLAPLVHRDLRDLARRLLGQEHRTGRLQPTELVHEAYLRLLDWRAVRWQNRAHFFATTAQMMRRILVSAARARRAEKRGSGAGYATGWRSKSRSGVVKVLRCPGEPCHPTDWSPDGQWLVLNAGSDVWKVEIEGGSATSLLDGPFVEHDARISPDGRWIAYVSNESGRPEVYIRTLSAPFRRLVASSGGNQPVWRRDGRALFYVSLDNELHVVSTQREGDGSAVAGARVKLPVGRLGRSHVGTTYDVSPDARRVYFPHEGDPARPREIHFVLNWSALVR